MNTQKGFVDTLLIIVAMVAIFSTTSYFIVARPIINEYRHQNAKPDTTACTQEAKLCPDGSYVGRTGKNCEFTECPLATPNPTVCEYPAPPLGCNYTQGPEYNQKTTCGMVLSCSTPNPNEEKVYLREGERNGPLLVENIYSNYVTGLNFRAYPVASNQGVPISLYIGESASNGCDVTLTLIIIQGGIATFTKKVDLNKNCPICLAENTLIDTPNGQIAVQDLKTGMGVWTINQFGNRVTGTITKTSKTATPPDHQIVHVILKDGREVSASPGHPIGDGRFFSNLSIGDMLHGSKILSAEKMNYSKNYTYDILPSGATKLYWANGILIGSTLK